MKKTAQPASTQAFTEVTDIRENVVLLSGGNACIIIKVTSVNFALLSGQEQDAKVFAYAALLNSLSFPIQIMIRSKPIHIEPYLASIDTEIQKSSNIQLVSYMRNYKDFVGSLVQTATVLDKQFFMVIPYSTLETSTPSALIKKKTTVSTEDFDNIQTTLETKAEGLLGQIHRLSLKAEILEKDELTRLFYDIYNQESMQTTDADMQNPMVKGTR